MRGSDHKRQVLISPPNFITTARWQTKRHRRRSWLFRKQASAHVGNKKKEVYLIVITDAKADLGGFTLEKHYQQTRDRMLKTMKNASVTQPISLTIDGHPAVQDELTRTEKGANVVFFTPPGTTAIISTNPRVDVEIAVAKTKPIAPRNYSKFSQREIEPFCPLWLDAS